MSLESATRHPLQSLADLVTIEELKTRNRPKVVLTWAPHVKPLPQCVANSFCQWVNAWEKSEFVITHPEDYELSEEFTKGATITHKQDEALTDADFVYVKNWSTYNDYGKIYSNNPRLKEIYDRQPALLTFHAAKDRQNNNCSAQSEPGIHYTN